MINSGSSVRGPFPLLLLFYCLFKTINWSIFHESTINILANWPVREKTGTTSQCTLSTLDNKIRLDRTKDIWSSEILWDWLPGIVSNRFQLPLALADHNRIIMTIIIGNNGQQLMLFSDDDWLITIVHTFGDCTKDGIGWSLNAVDVVGWRRHIGCLIRDWIILGSICASPPDWVLD